MSRIPNHSQQTATKKPLRIGLLVDSLLQPHWVYRIIDKISSSTFSELALVIKNTNPITTPSHRSKLHGYWKNKDSLLYELYGKIDNYKFNSKLDAFDDINLEHLIADCPILNIVPIRNKYSDRFDERDYEKILGFELDVALRFGFRILKGDALRIAKHGVWSYHHGDNLVNRGGPAGFWEVMEGSTTTGSILQVLTEDLDNGKVLCRSWAPTADRFSVKANRNNLYWKSTPFVLNKLFELSENGEVRGEGISTFPWYSNRLYRTPTNRELLPALLKLTGRYVLDKLKHRRYFNQWSLGYKFKSHPLDTNTTFYRYKYLTPPKDKFWADPFPVKVNGKYYIFFEEYVYEDQLGRISMIEIDRTGPIGEPVPVLERPYHLSYPFMFQWKGCHYMIPETSRNKGVELYRCLEFPYRWTLDKALLADVAASDATIVEANGLWWMFVSIASEGVVCPWDTLHLFYSDRPDGDWQPHRRNPIKLDVRNSRPAGKLFTFENELYRPAQDCSKHYGYAVTMNRVLQLDTTDYREEEVGKILPMWEKHLIGTHTYNSVEDLAVVDCLFQRRR